MGIGGERDQLGEAALAQDRLDLLVGGGSGAGFGDGRFGGRRGRGGPRGFADQMSLGEFGEIEVALARAGLGEAGLQRVEPILGEALAPPLALGQKIEKDAHEHRAFGGVLALRKGANERESLDPKHLMWLRGRTL